MNRLLDCYKILEVDFGAGREDIASSYKRLCRIYHPDVSGDPSSEERMKQINLAYAFVCDKLSSDESRASRASARTSTGTKSASSTLGARLVMESYFKALMDESYERAYGLLSDYDKGMVSFEDFRFWRKSVEHIYTMQSYSVTESSVGSTVTLSDGRKLSAKKCGVSIAEKNRSSGRLEHDTFVKLAVLERGIWRVFLGYRDLSTIAQTFNEKREENKRREMDTLWQQWRMDNCLELGVLSVTGFLKQARRELYSYRRYGRPFVIAAFDVGPPPDSQGGSERIIREAARAVSSFVREVDLVASAGDGVLIVLFSEMRKRHAPAITKRLVGKLEKRVLDELGEAVSVVSAFAPYKGGHLQREIDALLKMIYT